MSKEFILDQLGGERGAINFDKRGLSSRRVDMHGTGDQLLARAALSSHQDCGVAAGCSRSAAKNAPHSGGVSDDMIEVKRDRARVVWSQLIAQAGLIQDLEDLSAQSLQPSLISLLKMTLLLIEHLQDPQDIPSLLERDCEDVAGLIASLKIDPGAKALILLSIWNDERLSVERNPTCDSLSDAQTNLADLWQLSHTAHQLSPSMIDQIEGASIGLQATSDLLYQELKEFLQVHLFA